MRGSGDFLTNFLKNDIKELDGLIYDEETNAMFVDICKGICSIKESDPIPSSIKLSGDFSIDLIEGDEVQKVDDAVYNEKIEALEPASNNEIKSKITASRRKLKEGYKKHWKGSKKMIPLNFKDLHKPKGRGVHREPTMLVDIHKNICDIEESHSTPSATKQSSNLLMDFLEDEEVQEVYDAVYNEETEAIFLGICKTICDVKAPEAASNSQIESKIKASRRKLKEGYKDHEKGRRMTKLLDFKDLPKPEDLGVRRKRTKCMSADVPTRESVTDEVYKNCLRAVQIMLLAKFQIGLALLTAVSGHLSSSQVFRAIRQAMQCAPYYPKAHNLNGLVSEARHFYPFVIASFRLVRCLTKSSTYTIPRFVLTDISINLARVLMFGSPYHILGNALDAVRELEDLKREAVNIILKMPKALFQSIEVSFIISADHALDRNNRLESVVSSSLSCLSSHEEIMEMHLLIGMSKLVKQGSDDLIDMQSGVGHLKKAFHMYPNSTSIRHINFINGLLETILRLTFWHTILSASNNWHVFYLIACVSGSDEIADAAQCSSC
ncbi:hypothetical protein Ancab_037399 [Ancistrocladus abbreviatus]